MNKIRALLQAVGSLTLCLLALYGVLALTSGAGPLPVASRAQEALPNPAVTGTELVRARWSACRPTAARSHRRSTTRASCATRTASWSPTNTR